MEQKAQETEQVFTPINGEAEVTIVQSLCVNCEEQGVTKILPTNVPFFGNIILCSFSCDECGYKNNEVQQAAIKQRGVKLILKVLNERDLNRGIVISEYSVIKIYELEFEIPKNNQKGQITTIEGILQKVFVDLSHGQPVRKIQELEKAQQIEEFLIRLSQCMSVQTQFTLELDDPSGNAAIESFIVNDPQLVRKDYERSMIQLREMGFLEENLPDLQQLQLETSDPTDSMVFQVPCSQCGQMGENRSCVVTIPHFGQVVTMGFKCDECGFKSVDVKSGGGVPPKGKKLTLHVQDLADLNRDVVKSEHAYMCIPEVELELSPGTLGGIVTTVEGILTQIKNALSKTNPFVLGDSASMSEFGNFLHKLKELIQGQVQFTLIIDDPLAGSFIGGEGVQVEEYERTWEQNEELGLNDMNTENYLQEQQQLDNKFNNIQFLIFEAYKNYTSFELKQNRYYILASGYLSYFLFQIYFYILAITCQCMEQLESYILLKNAANFYKFQFLLIKISCLICQQTKFRKHIS